MPTEGLGDLFVTDLLVRGRRLSATLEEAIIDADIERTIEGASTITITFTDPNNVILQSTLMNSRTQITVDVLVFELVQVQKQGTTLKAVFEDEKVARLRRKKGFKKAGREKMTRAEFSKSLVNEVKGITFFCPQLHVEQPAEGISIKEKKAQKDKKREKGYGPLTNLEVAGIRATDAQKDVLETVIRVGYKLSAPDAVLIAALETVIVESHAGAIVIPGVAPDGVKGGPGRSGDKDSAGIFQQRPSKGWGTYEQVIDDEYASTQFYNRAIPYFRKYPNLESGKIAQSVQVSGYPYRYTTRESEASAALSAYRGGGLSGTPEQLVAEPYEFKRGEPWDGTEDTWTCITRLAEEVNWHCFSLGSTIYFISNDDLVSSRPRMELTERTIGVDKIDFDWDTGKRATTATVYCRADRWYAPPGTVVTLGELGPADGRWLVSNIRRSLFSTATTIKLIRYSKPKLEPVTYTQQKDIGSMSDEEVAGLAKLAPGADRKGVTTSDWVIDYARRMAAIVGKPITITTGTNHRQYVNNNPSDGESDHWTGNAMDIGGVANGFPDATPGSAHTRGDDIASAAMQVGGENPAAADAQALKGGVWNYEYNEGSNKFKINILWRTHTGGNHYNHVHVGVAPIGAIKYDGDTGTPTDDTEIDPQSAYRHQGDETLGDAARTYSGDYGTSSLDPEARFTRGDDNPRGR